MFFNRRSLLHLPQAGKRYPRAADQLHYRQNLRRPRYWCASGEATARVLIKSHLKRRRSGSVLSEPAGQVSFGLEIQQRITERFHLFNGELLDLSPHGWRDRADPPLQ